MTEGTTLATMAGLTWLDWFSLFGYYVSISLLAIGGVIATTPDMHRFLVARHGWLSDPQFSASIAIAQAAPGPNVLFVALMGWNVGINAAGQAGSATWAAYALGFLGACIAMLGVMLPSTTLTFFAARWGHRNRNLRAVRAFKQGMAPVVIGLLVASAWVLGSVHANPETDWRLWLLTASTSVVVWRTRLHLLWLLGTGALLGVLGWV